MDEQLLAYAQNRMTSADRDAFEKTLAQDANLRAEVAAMAAVKGVIAQDATDLPAGGWERFVDKIEASHPVAANKNRPLRLSLAQAACVALAAVLGWQAIEATVLSIADTEFEQASIGSEQPALQIIFNGSTTIDIVNDILGELDGTITSGPSALGLYTVAFADEDKREAAFAVLYARKDLVDDVLKN